MFTQRSRKNPSSKNPIRDKIENIIFSAYREVERDAFFVRHPVFLIEGDFFEMTGKWQLEIQYSVYFIK